MVTTTQLDDLVKKLLALMPKELSTLNQDLSKTMRSVLQAGLANLDLVTREEFDAQVAVLQRTRKQLRDLEHKIETLEGVGPAIKSRDDNRGSKSQDAKKGRKKRE